eukprot:gene12189-15312_t
MDGNRWAVGECIGKGAFGEAYLCVDAKSKQKYVLKKIRMARQTEWQRKATIQEIELVANLRHPFIVPYMEHWIHHGHTGKPFEEQQLQDWLAQLLLALNHMQDKRVLDFGLATVPHHYGQDFGLATVPKHYGQDFGLATVRNHSMQVGDVGRQDQSLGQDPQELPPPSSMLHSNTDDDYSTVGTPHYMSPELLSQKSYCFKTDVWSLGCLAYELSAHRPAFNAFNLRGLHAPEGAFQTALGF